MLRIRFDQFLWILPLLGMLASGKSTAASEMASTGTRFEGSAFACTGVSAYPDDQMLVAVTEESKLLSDIGINLHCADNFQDLDFNNPPWGQKDNQHFLSKVYDLIEFISQFPEAFRYKDGRWQYNTPNCTDAMKSAQVCGIRVRVLANFYYKDGQTQYLNTESNAVIYDACPRNHWNNAIKQSPMHPDYAGIGNPCGADKKDHVDLYGALWYRLGFPKDLNSAHLTVSIIAGQNQSQGWQDHSTCPDGSNGPGKGYGLIYACGDKICAKSDLDYLNECVIGD